jgi:protein TonB
LITFGILFVMQALVSHDLGELPPAMPSSKIEFVRVIKDTESPPHTPRVKPEILPEPPDTPPIHTPPVSRPGQTIHTVEIGIEEGPLLEKDHGFSPVTDGDAVPLFRPNPTYPPQAKIRGLEGWVTVEFTITAAGTVRSPSVIGSSHRIFERAALRAIRKWRYSPKTEDGRAVERHGIRVRLSFELDKA